MIAVSDDKPEALEYDGNDFKQELYDYTAAVAAGTPFERFSGREIYEICLALEGYEREAYYPANELVLYRALRDLGVDHRTLVKAYASLPRYHREKL